MTVKCRSENEKKEERPSFVGTSSIFCRRRQSLSTLSWILGPQIIVGIFAGIEEILLITTTTCGCGCGFRRRSDDRKSIGERSKDIGEKFLSGGGRRGMMMSVRVLILKKKLELSSILLTLKELLDNSVPIGREIKNTHLHWWWRLWIDLLLWVWIWIY